MIANLTLGTRTGQVCITWTNEPTVEDLDDLTEYLALYRRVIEKKSSQEPSAVLGNASKGDE